MTRNSRAYVQCRSSSNKSDIARPNMVAPLRLGVAFYMSVLAIPAEATATSAEPAEVALTTVETSTGNSAPAPSVEKPQGAATAAPPGSAGRQSMVQSSPAPVSSVLSADAEVKRLEELFNNYRSDFGRFQLWTALTLIPAAAVTLSSSVVVVRHTSAHSLVAPIIAGVGGAELGTALALLLNPSGSDADFTRLAALVNEERAAGKISSEILRSVDSEWKKRTDEARKYRVFAGVLGVSIGTLGVGSGAVLALADGTSSLRNQRYGWSAVCFGAGFLGLSSGLRWFFFETPIEVAWKTHKASFPDRQSLLRQVQMVPTPLNGGGALSIEGRF